MKTSRLLAIIAVLSISLLVFLIALNSVILGNDKTSELTTETLISQIRDLQKEIEVLKERISRLEGGQEIRPTVPQDLPALPKLKTPSTVPRDLPSVNAIPDINQLPKGTVKREINGMTYYIIPLQDQNVDKLVLPGHK